MTMPGHVHVDLDTLATALYVRIDDELKAPPQLNRWRPAVGIAPRITDAELITVSVMQALLGYHNESRWIRHARKAIIHLFPYLPKQPGYNKLLRALSAQLAYFIAALVADTDLWQGAFPQEPPHRAAPAVPRVGGPVRRPATRDEELGAITATTGMDAEISTAPTSAIRCARRDRFEAITYHQQEASAMPRAYESCAETVPVHRHIGTSGRSASERPPLSCGPGSWVASASLPSTSTKAARPAADRPLSSTDRSAADALNSACPRARQRRPVVSGSRQISEPGDRVSYPFDKAADPAGMRRRQGSRRTPRKTDESCSGRRAFPRAQSISRQNCP